MIVFGSKCLHIDNIKSTLKAKPDIQRPISILFWFDQVRNAIVKVVDHVFEIVETCQRNCFLFGQPPEFGVLLGQ